MDAGYILQRLRRVADDERSTDVTHRAIGYLRMRFGTPRSPGIDSQSPRSAASAIAATSPQRW